MTDLHLSTGREKNISRRRCIGIIASSIAGAMTMGTSAAIAGASKLKKLRWSGYVIGADASITLYTDDPAKAKTLISSMLKEIRRLENLFSLFQKDSLLQQLNNEGIVNNPDPSFYHLVSTSLKVAAQSEGRFDPTIQPLFMAYKTCAREGVDQPWSAQLSVQDAIKLIDWRNVECAPSRIKFKTNGMGLTLNGIAQGYITDKASDIIREAGFTETLINFGEYRALEPTHGRDGWRIQLGDGRVNKDIPVWTIKNAAIAASSGYDYVFDKQEKLHHLIDPKSGLSRKDWLEIYVEAPSAMLADAASTALFATPPEDIQRTAKQLGVTRALLVKADGSSLSV